MTDELPTKPETRSAAERLARSYASEAISLYVCIMRDPKAKTQDRKAAADALLDRGFGKPRQPEPKPIGNKNGKGSVTMTTSQLMDIVAAAQRAGRLKPIEGKLIPRSQPEVTDVEPAPADTTVDDLMS